MLAAGSKAPDFSLKDVSGKPQTLKDLVPRGPVLLALYKVSCPVCQMTLPYLERISKGSLPVIAISQDDESATKRFQQTYGLTLPTLLDRAEDAYPVSNAFGITHVPSLFLLESDGAISLAGSGFRKSELEQLGERSGVPVFRQDENVPEWKAG